MILLTNHFVRLRPMFEEDVPSVLELEMEELDQWMKKDGRCQELLILDDMWLKNVQKEHGTLFPLF